MTTHRPAPTTTSGNTPLDQPEIDAFRDLIFRVGENKALELARLSRIAAYRALAALPVNAGTRALIVAALDHRRAA